MCEKRRDHSNSFRRNGGGPLNLKCTEKSHSQVKGRECSMKAESYIHRLNLKSNLNLNLNNHGLRLQLHEHEHEHGQA